MLRLPALLLTCLLAPIVFAQGSAFWDGGPTGTGSVWSVAANWSGDTLPTGTQEAVFDGSVIPPAPITGVSGNVAALRVWGSNPFDLSLVLSGDLYLQGNGEALTLDQAHGLSIASGANTVSFGGGITIRDGDLTISGAVLLGRTNGQTYVEILQRGSGDIDFGPTTAPQVIGGAGGGSFVRFQRLAPAAGVIRLGSLTIEGDTNDDVAGNESDAAEVQFENVELRVSGDIDLRDGSGPVGNAGGGGEMYFGHGSLLRLGGDINVGNLAASNIESPAHLSLNEASVVFSDGGTTTVRVHTLTAALFLLVDVTSAGPWSLVADADATAVIMLQSSFSADAPGNMSLTIGGQGGAMFPGAAIAGCQFSNLDAAGLQVAPGTVLAMLAETDFTAGQSTGTHLSLDGLAAASTAVAELVHFDGSTASLVTVNAATPLQFRVPAGDSFGIGTTINATQAEALDNDGGSVGSNVTWQDSATEVSVRFPATQPFGIHADTTADQVACFLELEGIVGSSLIDSIALNVEVSDWGSGFAFSDIAAIKLFDDANANGALDGGELLVAGGLAANVVTFDLTGLGAGARTIASGVTKSWGMAITFNATINSGPQRSGKIQFFSLVGGIVEAGGGIVSGLPLLLFDVTWVAGPMYELRNSVRADLAYAGLPFLVQPELEVRDVNDVLCGWANGTVTPSISADPNGGASSLTGSNAAGVTVVNGRAVFSDLGLDLGGTGFTLDFTYGAALPGQTVVSMWLDVEGAPGEIGVEVAAQPVADGGSHTLGTRRQGVAFPVQYTVLNTGSGDLNLTGTAPVQPAGNVNCTVTLLAGPGSNQIAPAGSTTFTLQVTPTAVGAFSFSVEVANDDPDENPYSWDATGTAGEPEVEIRRVSAVIANGGTDSISGARPGQALVLTYSIHNTGSFDLALSGAVGAVAGGNCTTSTTQPGSSTIAAGSSSDFIVTLTPTADGAFDAAISFACDDANEAACAFSIAGIAQTPSSDDKKEDAGCVSSADVRHDIFDALFFAMILFTSLYYTLKKRQAKK